MDSEQLKREILAQMQLQDAGSVMARPQLPEWRKDNPTLNAILSVLDLGAGLGPSPVDAFGGKAAQLAGQAGLGQLLSGLLGLGGEPSGAQEAGVYRQLGMQRAGGFLNPKEYIQKLQELPNYQRYLQLVQQMVRRGLGEQFPVARGKQHNDPLMQALQQNLSGEQLPATAVTYGVGGTGFSDTAEKFAREAAEKTRKPTYVAQGTARPEDVAALVPRRQAYSHEKELVLKPTSGFQPQLAARYIPPSGQFPFVERKSLLPTVDPTTSQILEALAEAAQPPAY